MKMYKKKSAIRRERRRIAYVVGGLAALGLAGVGVYYGLRAINANVNLPNGGTVNLQSGNMTVTTTTGKTLTFTLPSGATWAQTAMTATATSVLGNLSLPTAATSAPMPYITTSNDTLTLAWQTSGGTLESTVVTINTGGTAAASTTPATPATPALPSATG